MQVDPYAATNALARGFDQMEGMAMSRARRQAGNALSAGNEAAAMSALGAAGDLAGQQAIGAGMDRRAAAEMQREQQEREARLDFLRQGAESLMRVPPDQRGEVYRGTLRPVLQQMGYPDEILSRLDTAQMGDNELRSLIVAAGGEIASPTAGDRQAGGRIVRPDPYTGQYTEVYAAPERENAPAGYRVTADGNLEFIPGGPADPRVISGAAGARRAPPRPRGSGSGVNGSARPGSQGQAAPAAPRAGLPSGFTVRRR